MTKEEFENKLQEFMEWTSLRDRPASQWFLSLQEWAMREFDRTYEQEHH